MNILFSILNNILLEIMFATITENPYHPQGKLANETTRKMIATQYTLGDYNQRWESNTKSSF
jgi:hypothetical protein